MPKAVWNGEVIAESDDTVIVEGNHYFPRESVRAEYLRDSDTHSICPWKGTASYQSLEVNGKTQRGRALVLPGAEGRGQADHRPGRLLEGRRGQRVTPSVRWARTALAGVGAHRQGGRMRLLVLGGTRFLGRGIVDAALANGDQVTTFTRGKSGEPPDSVEALHGDRNRPDGMDVLRGREWDAVIDTSGFVPTVVGRGAALLAGSVGHYVFVSSLNAYPVVRRRADPGRQPGARLRAGRRLTGRRVRAGAVRPVQGRLASARSTSTSPAGRRTCGPA